MDKNQNGYIRNNINMFAIFYRLVDLLIIQICLYIATVVYGVEYTSYYTSVSLMAMAGFFITSETFALYRSWRSGYFKQIVFYTSLTWLVTTFILLSILFFTKLNLNYSNQAFALWFALSWFGLIFWRYCFSIILKDIRRKGFNTRRVALMGLTDTGSALAQEILNNPDTGYRLSAIYDDRDIKRIPATYHNKFAGSIDEGVSKARENQFDVVFLALPLQARDRVHQILEKLGDTTANVHVVPDLFLFNLMSSKMSHVGEVQTISVYDTPLHGSNAMIKRLEDIVLSSIILCLISIPLLVIALAVKLTSKGPVIFKQDRYGLDGSKIKVWKFRSMTVTENSNVVTQATANDTRVTPVGRFLRRTSLDELPQFFNVLSGQMSVVGPRPHAVVHNEEYRHKVGYYMLRHKVKPGITGWAQVNGWRGETDTIDKMKMRVEYDLDYIRNWSLWMDFKIVLFTIFRSFNDKNAY